MLRRIILVGARAAVRPSVLLRRPAVVPSVHAVVASGRLMMPRLLPPHTSAFSTASAGDRRPPPHPSESFLSGTNSTLLEEMHESWKANPSSVDSTWQHFFENVDKSVEPGSALPPIPRFSKYAEAAQTDPASGNFNIAESYKIFLLARSYRVLGHFAADLDPLGLQKILHDPFTRVKQEYLKDLLPETYGFTEADLDREFFTGPDLPGNKPIRTLREIVDLLSKTYCSRVGVQFMHLSSPSKKKWIQQKMEHELPNHKFTKDEKIAIYTGLVHGELFEKFLKVKFNTKRFGLDGSESLIPGLETLVHEAAAHGIESLVFGMPHRGRLCVLANIIGKPLPVMFNEFEMDKPSLASTVEGTGDVKYHLGTSQTRHLPSGKLINLSMTSNPSHLEAVNTVVEGRTRAKQDRKGEQDLNAAMSVLMHGDAAFAGQGIVGEMLEMSGLKDFSTGGTVHIIVNNQIGFTTVPKYSRTSPYPSELAKASGAPVWHVNGDDPEQVVRVFKLAIEYRQQFNRDVVVDLYCYRRYGHNELDEPRFTQPLMYSKIDSHPSTLTIYEQQLINEGVLTDEQAKAIRSRYASALEKGFADREKLTSVTSEWLESKWKGFKSASQRARIKPTGVPIETLKLVGNALTHVPQDIKVHKKRIADLQNKQTMFASGKNLDWATGEALAYGTLLNEGYDVRLCGQDCERGTFSHRHAVLYCQETEKKYRPLDHVSPNQGSFSVINSSLSELAVLGFEHGYSLEDPNRLVLWEAQFGDFANGAQVIYDQFIASGEKKWLRMSGLVMLLPHGYEGQGPEHSSARLERYLQSCDDDYRVFPTDTVAQAQEINLQVVNCTTPANFFHVLRRQLHREYRKPLVVMTPKRGLQYRTVKSNIEDFGPDSSFRRLIPETRTTLVPDNEIRRLVFASGNVYHDLVAERDEVLPTKDGHGDERKVAICRVEQYAPFPYDKVKEQIARYPNAETVWVQEEPMNMGAWSYVSPRIETASGGTLRPRYIGRGPLAATATGIPAKHKQELRQMLSDTFSF